MRRSNNQDSLSALPAKTAKRFRSHGHLFVVADGMGAHAAGELASGMATEQVAMSYFRGTQSVAANLHAALVEANREIHNRGRSNPEFHQMGTTASALVLGPEGAWIGHVGDSRVYRLRNDRLEQLTFDHSLAWEVAATGQSNLNVPRNVITRSLGPSPDVEVDLEGPLEVQPGDRFLLCSDGLTGPVEDSELGVLMSCLSPDRAVNVLVDLANLRGGPDNISLIIVEAGEAEKESELKVSGKAAELPKSLIATSVICLCVALILFALSMTGPSLVALVLALIVGVIAAIQSVRESAGTRRPSGAYDGSSVPTARGGAPYRRYDAKPNRTLYDRMGQTVMELRQAAEQRGWELDWNRVDTLSSEGDQMVTEGRWCDAIAKRAETIIETMNQLRNQHDRAASETKVD